MSLAVTMPALAANVDFTVATTGTPGEVEISYNAETGHGLRGIALRVDLVGCELTGPGDVGAMGSGFNTAIDFARDMEVGTPGSYGGPLPSQSDQHPIAAIPGPGVATFPATTFSISAGRLASDQSTTPEGSGNSIITLQLTDTNGASESYITISADTSRGGPAVNDNAAPTFSFPPPISTCKCPPPSGPDCWSSPTQCYGDAASSVWDISDGVVDNWDWIPFRDGYLKSYPHADYVTNVCADNTKDGSIDNFDWISFRDNYLKGALPTNCTPGGTWPPL